MQWTPISASTRLLWRGATCRIANSIALCSSIAAGFHSLRIVIGSPDRAPRPEAAGQPKTPFKSLPVIEDFPYADNHERLRGFCRGSPWLSACRDLGYDVRFLPKVIVAGRAEYEIRHFGCPTVAEYEGVSV